MYTMKFRDRFFVHESADTRYGITIVVRPKDWVYLDIYIGTIYLVICLWRLKDEKRNS